MRLIGTAASGIRAQQAALDTVGNDIANVNTIGYKESEVTFAETLTNVRRGEGTTVLGMPVGGMLDVGVGAKISGLRTNFETGKMLAGESVLDLAIDGDGFFQVLRPNGEVAYTRAGSFKADQDGNIVDNHGNFLEPSINIKDGTDLAVSHEGLVTGKLYGEEYEFGQITLVKFINPEGLYKMENSLFSATENSGLPETGAGNGDGFGMIRSYALEGSNVELTKSMTDLIQIQRAYQLNSRMVNNGDQMWSMANELKRR